MPTSVPDDIGDFVNGGINGPNTRNAEEKKRQKKDQDEIEELKRQLSAQKKVIKNMEPVDRSKTPKMQVDAAQSKDSPYALSADGFWKNAAHSQINSDILAAVKDDQQNLGEGTKNFINTYTLMVGRWLILSNLEFEDIELTESRLLKIYEKYKDNPRPLLLKMLNIKDLGDS